MCRYAQFYAFISVIELPRIPAYCPKVNRPIKKFLRNFIDFLSFLYDNICGRYLFYDSDL